MGKHWKHYLQRQGDGPAPQTIVIVATREQLLQAAMERALALLAAVNVDWTFSECQRQITAAADELRKGLGKHDTR
jgi:hypothetical protein